MAFQLEQQALWLHQKRLIYRTNKIAMTMVLGFHITKQLTLK